MGSIGSKRKNLSQEGEEVNFDHFQVLRAIGKGSFGKVCIVQKLSSERLFAMKYMNKAQCEAKDAVPNVFREIEILASVEHPFLVNLWFSFQDEEDMFMVVDLLLGGDLRYHVQQGVPFSNEAIRLFILEAGSALDYLHRRNIIHRDIKPDNLLLDETGHVHLTDFNIATVLREGHLATSMSGTKPYMAPEVFECAADCCDGYDRSVDWWSLGVSAYEIRRGVRPYDIHSNTTISEVRLMFLSPPKYPSDWSLGFVQLLSKLLTVSPGSRVTTLESLMRIPFAAEISIDDVIKKKIKPSFVPAKDHLNCDPTFELEEMIIESKPLHKKKKRLLKQKSVRDSQQALNLTTQISNSGSINYESMIIFNREREEARKARERKEREWQEELDRSMNMSDPTGHGSGFCGSKMSFRRKRSTKDSDVLEGVLNTLIAASAKSFAASIGPIQEFTVLESTPSLKPISPSTTKRAPLPDLVSQRISSGNSTLATSTDSFDPSKTPNESVANKLGETTVGSNIEASLHEKSQVIKEMENLHLNIQDYNDKISERESAATSSTMTRESESNSETDSPYEILTEEASDDPQADVVEPKEKSFLPKDNSFTKVNNNNNLEEIVLTRNSKSSNKCTSMLRPTSAPSAVNSNVVQAKLQQSLGQKIPPKIMKSKVRNITKETKRSQSFNTTSEGRHEKFLPQRYSLDVIKSSNSCDKVSSTLADAGRERQSRIAADNQPPTTVLRKEKAKSVSMNLCSLSERYTSSLEFISSSSVHLQKPQRRPKSILRDSKRSASEETQLHVSSLSDDELRSAQTTEGELRSALITEGELRSAQTTEGELRPTLITDDRRKTNTRLKNALENVTEIQGKTSAKRSSKSNKECFCKTISSQSLQPSTSTSRDVTKAYKRSISIDNPKIQKSLVNDHYSSTQKGQFSATSSDVSSYTEELKH